MARKGSPPTPTGAPTTAVQTAAGLTGRCSRPRTDSARRSPPGCPSGAGSRGHQAGDQDPAPAGRAGLARSSPGEEFMALWGTGYDAGRAFIEIEHRHQMIQRFWTNRANPAADQAGGDRGDARRIHRPRHPGPREPRLPRLAPRRGALEQQGTRAELGAFHLETRSPARRKPGRCRSDRSPKSAKRNPKAVAEMVATLYDESLDAFAAARLAAAASTSSARTTAPPSRSSSNPLEGFQHSSGNWQPGPCRPSLSPTAHFPPDLIGQPLGLRLLRYGRGRQGRGLRHEADGRGRRHGGSMPSRWRDRWQRRRRQWQTEAADSRRRRECLGGGPGRQLAAEGAARAGMPPPRPSPI